MPTRRLYPREFREQLVELVRAGRTPESLAKEFEPSAQTIRNWAKQADSFGLWQPIPDHVRNEL